MTSDLVIAVPIHDRRSTHAFHTALGLPTVGPPAGDGLPEPLQFRLRDGVVLMGIPRGGFERATGPVPCATAGTVSCLLSRSVADDAAVDATYDAAIDAGATPVAGPQDQPWGREAQYLDPDGHLWAVVSPPAGA